ncbi:hypothetical protein PoB_003399900 [Plakobranchus ocellatus]|uniref:Mutator-like transposase domain-containing protein n=1 Tax=Plakobranchus ocellatus TaxID=259542 RepID=A0AAV4AMA2_9GAST|nr:hypothetical protein PoB_003399900 [Plakobranchus ocellatus]
MRRRKYAKRPKVLESTRLKRKAFRSSSPPAVPPNATDNGNQVRSSCPALEYVHSRTEQKCAHFGQDSGLETNPEVVRTVVDLGQIGLLAKQVSCPECLTKGTIRLRQDQRKGLVVRLSRSVMNVTNVTEPVFSSATELDAPGTNKPFNINKAATCASLQVGLGLYKFNNFCQFINMHGIDQKTFDKFASRMYEQNNYLADSVSKTACEIIRQAYTKEGEVPDEDGCFEIAVSYDGSWLTRGYKSLIDIGSVVDVLTGPRSGYSCNESALSDLLNNR